MTLLILFQKRERLICTEQLFLRFVGDAISSRSCIRTGPRGLAVREFFLSPTGTPAAVVIVLRLLTFSISVAGGRRKFGVRDAGEVPFGEEQSLLVGAVEICTVNRTA